MAPAIYAAAEPREYTDLTDSQVTQPSPHCSSHAAPFSVEHVDPEVPRNSVSTLYWDPWAAAAAKA